MVRSAYNYCEIFFTKINQNVYYKCFISINLLNKKLQFRAHSISKLPCAIWTSIRYWQSRRQSNLWYQSKLCDLCCESASVSICVHIMLMLLSMKWKFERKVVYKLIDWRTSWFNIDKWDFVNNILWSKYSLYVMVYEISYCTSTCSIFFICEWALLIYDAPMLLWWCEYVFFLGVARRNASKLIYS